MQKKENREGNKKHEYTTFRESTEYFTAFIKQKAVNGTIEFTLKINDETCVN